MYSRRRSKETDVVDISLRNFDHVGRVLQQVSAFHVGKYSVDWMAQLYRPCSWKPCTYAVELHLNSCTRINSVKMMTMFIVTVSRRRRFSPVDSSALYTEGKALIR